MFNQQIKVPVSIVCELTDIKESRLQKDYTMNYFPDSFRLRDTIAFSGSELNTFKHIQIIPHIQNW